MPDTTSFDLTPRNLRRRFAADPFERMREDLNDVFGAYLRPWTSRRDGEAGDIIAPLRTSLDLSETEDSVQVILDVPGVDQDKIDISLTDVGLTVSGVRDEETETKDKQFHRVERSFGSFSRTIPLPCEVDHEKVAAELKKGVLTITLPKTERARQRERKIPIKKG